MPERTCVTPQYVERGTGVPVLAIHGWSPDHRLMLGCLEPLFRRRGGYRRLYPDLPAMGATPAPPSIASSDDILDVVLDFVDDVIGEAPFLVVGESYGGYLARALARRLTAQVLGLALICPMGLAVADADRTLPPRVVPHPNPDLLGTLDEPTRASFASIAVVHTEETARRFREEVQPGLDAADSEAMSRIFRRWHLNEDPEGGEPFQGPTLILTGRQDHVVGYVDQYALLDHYPRATFAVLDNAGHNLQLERPAPFEALMLDWLDRVAEDVPEGHPLPGRVG